LQLTSKHFHILWRIYRQLDLPTIQAEFDTHLAIISAQNQHFSRTSSVMGPNNMGFSISKPNAYLLSIITEIHAIVADVTTWPLDHL